ncbi:MAG: protein-disulfide reductase DsbD [Gammaproteobacteria bacterium]
MIKIEFSKFTKIVRWLIVLCCVTSAWAATKPTLGAPPSDILPPEKAFQVTVEKVTPDSVTLDFLIAPRTYLYQKAFRFTAEHDEVGTPQFPKAKSINDPFLGNTAIYREEAHISLPLSPTLTESFLLEVTYQGCHELGFCYPPQTVQLTIMPLGSSEVLNGAAPAPTVASKPFDVLTKHNGWALLAFLGFGILLSFTPCVLPMVPILSALILGEQQKHHPLKAFTLALAYVLGMASTYAALGAIVGSVGARVQAELQNPWVLISTAVLLVIFAGMLIHHKPQAFLSRLSGAFHRLSHALPQGEYIGVALMGILASLVISPCVTPPLVGALTFITMEGSVWFGSFALFLLGLGMGLPLLAVTWLGTAILPKRGPWMQRVKYILAFLLILMAGNLVWRLVPTTHEPGIFTVVTTQKGLESALLEAKKAQKPAMVDFYADWCVSCVQMDKTVFSEVDVQALLKPYALIKVDLTESTDEVQALLKTWKLFGPPAYLFFDDKGQELTSARINGEMDKGQFMDYVKHLRR